MEADQAGRRRRGLFGLMLFALVLAGCGPGNGAQGITVAVMPDEEGLITVQQGGDFFPVSGQFLYEDIFVDPEDLGAGVQTVIRPVRAADVVVLDGNTLAEIQLARTATDDNGNFQVFAPQGSTFFVAVRARIDVRGDRVLAGVATDTTSNSIYTVGIGQEDGSPVVPAAGTVSITFAPFLIESDLPFRESGAFNMLDAVLTAADQFRTQTGSAAPGPVTLFWNLLDTSGSFFNPVYGPGDTPGIQIRGGDDSMMNTDEFDDGVIQHEFGHFIAFSTSRDSSLGGGHGVFEQLYPSLSWSEGFANYFSGFARGRPVVGDVAFLTSTDPMTPTAVGVLSLENAAVPDPGLDVEATVAEVLWDLSDGTVSGFPNSDGDTVDLNLQSVFVPFFDLRTQSPPPYVDLYEYLIALTNRGILSVATVNNLLNVNPENQTIPFPPGAADVFPQPIVVNGPIITDNCQTRTATDNMSTGLAVSNRFRIFTLGADTTITVRVTNTTVNGLNPGVTGEDQNGTNLEHLVLTVDNDLAVDLNTGLPLTPFTPRQLAIEAESGRLAAGTYVIFVFGRTQLGGPLTNAASVANSFTVQVTSP